MKWEIRERIKNELKPGDVLILLNKRTGKQEEFLVGDVNASGCDHCCAYDECSGVLEDSRDYAFVGVRPYENS